MSMTATPVQAAAPLPKSYLAEAEKVGKTQNTIYIAESFAADRAGDDEAAWCWLALAEVPKPTMEFLKEVKGVEFLKSKGFVING